ncbi:hypothetical protein N7492_009078 [Penicillium capsulatum]|uniref:Uncharacterized protein n=1 Tax=Penicillium capsulatum TaxID=69766 RepID=A0A9W9HTY2_9EURO|nr:hypothetical protein N7492_009078 [Penicillium capsulatum]KAJ6106477.1 hypothetical protein N7512_009994 [Penicillium capsulatum]
MSSRDQPPVHVPLRTSSRNPRTTKIDRDEGMSYPERKTSKAQRILGTDAPIPGHGGWDSLHQKSHNPPKPRRSNPRTPDSTSRLQNTGFVPFPAGEAALPPQNLRIRASSPLLGHDYRSQDPAPPLPKPSKKIHATSSSSTLFSYFSSKDNGSKSKPASSHGVQSQVQSKLGMDPQVPLPSQPPPKESKRKLRPPRIDLSLLFPKPRNPAPPLLSPQRMTNSPCPASPVSTVVSDYPSNKLDRARSNSTTQRYGDSLPRAPAAQPEAPKPAVDRSDLLSIPESKDSTWHEHQNPIERTVGTSEIDLALDRYAARRSLVSRSSVYTNSREQLRAEPQRSDTKSSSRRAHSPSNSTRRNRPNLVPESTSQRDANQRKLSASEESCRKEVPGSRGAKSSMSRKSSKSTLKNKDLQNSSVLCLSSSEDEEEEQEPQPVEPPLSAKRFRESVATYGDFEPQIYTASTAQAATAHMLRRIDRAPSTSSYGSHRTLASQPKTTSSRHVQNPSTSSTGNASCTTRRTTQSRRSSGIPAISEPDILDKFPQQPLRTPHELKEMNRRSRVIAVTRQEQDLLEAMRQRKGKITPSIFNANPSSEADRASVLSGPSRDSFCGSDTSFLRLSAVFPPLPGRPDQGAVHTEKNGSPSQSSVSDSDQKTGNSIASPRFSSNYSESLPSPATSGTSPLTPTLPIHRFSPLPSPKPPPRGPPPAIPEDQKQHSRRRTDSSEAIMLTESNDVPRKHDFPLWAFDFDWNHDRASVAAVH